MKPIDPNWRAHQRGKDSAASRALLNIILLDLLAVGVLLAASLL